MSGLRKTANMRSPGMLPPRPLPASIRRRAAPELRVAGVAGERFRGKITIGSTVFACVLGPAGIVRLKREGDGATPAGSYRLQRLLFRPDRGARPATILPTRPIRMRDGWCDDVGSVRYNHPVQLPCPARHERLWRDDRLYDLLVVIEYNLGPTIKGRGSAIFLHIQSPDKRPTAGCVAVAPAVLRRLLGRLGPGTRIRIA